MKAERLAISQDEMMPFLEEVFPAVAGYYALEELAPMRARMRLTPGPRDIRPGGTLSGPSMFGLTDVTFYVAVMGMIGREALTVTTNATINFLRKPSEADLICDVRLLKLGKLLATGDATLFSAGQAEPVAHATMTYAIPPRPQN